MKLGPSDRYAAEQIKKLKAQYEEYEKVLKDAIQRNDKELIIGSTFIMDNIKAQLAAFY